MKDSTSIHSLNADRGITRPQKVMYLLLNLINNNFFPRAVDPGLVIKDFVTEISEAEWSSSPIKASPSRKLSDLFLMKLPWAQIKAELGRINILDTGCGSGQYGVRLRSFSDQNIDSYVGIDINEHPNWSRITDLYPNFRFLQLDSRNILNHIPPETNFFTTQSALEHFTHDLLYFQQVRDFILKTSKEVIQVHLFPSSNCLRLYRFHGIRQYTPRTISKITRIFDGFSYSVLFNLGGERCNSVHYEFITRPALIKKNSDRRDTSTEEYDRRLLAAVKEDMRRPGMMPNFYALLIHSNGKKRLY